MNINPVLARPVGTTIVAAALSLLVTTGLFTAVAACSCAMALHCRMSSSRSVPAANWRSCPNGKHACDRSLPRPCSARREPLKPCRVRLRFSASERAQRSRAVSPSCIPPLWPLRVTPERTGPARRRYAGRIGARAFDLLIAFVERPAADHEGRSPRRRMAGGRRGGEQPAGAGVPRCAR